MTNLEILEKESIDFKLSTALSLECWTFVGVESIKVKKISTAWNQRGPFFPNLNCTTNVATI